MEATASNNAGDISERETSQPKNLDPAAVPETTYLNSNRIAEKTSSSCAEQEEEEIKVEEEELQEQDFLKRAELREYEIERDARLASDVRSRGRL